MRSNEELIRELYALSEGPGMDLEKLVSMFSDEGYMRDMATGLEFRGHAIGESIAGFAKAFPDFHREFSSIYAMGDVVIVELSTRATHSGELSLPSGTLAPTGKVIDVPSCDVYHLEGGKVTSFHCYNELSVLQQQLGITPD